MTQMSTLIILTEKHALQIRGIPTMYLGHVSEQTKNNWGLIQCPAHTTLGSHQPLKSFILPGSWLFLGGSCQDCQRMW